jgi:hypothetical protein
MPLETVAHEAVENDKRAVFGRLQAPDDLALDDRLAYEPKHIVGDGRLLAAADRR